MPGHLDKLLEKGKAKLKEYTGSSSHHTHGGYPGQQPQHNYTPQYPGYPQQHTQHPPPPSPYNTQPTAPQQQSYNGPPTWGPPQQQWGQPSPNQWAQAPQQQQPFTPPIPSHSKPQLSQPPAPAHPQSSPGLKVYWQATFDASSPVTLNFRHELGDHGWGNNEKQNYVDSPANAFHHDGRLIVRGLVQNGSYTSARLTSHQTLSRPRGYLTATILPPCAEGIWPAYWLLPKDPFEWPNDGEIDIFESWNGDCQNHSCLHWGHYNGEDWNKHRVLETQLPDMSHRPHTFGFAWMEEEGIPGWRGRMIWYIDGRPVMKANIPQGTRRMEDYRIIINIAMGGNVCDGNLPKDGYYDLIVSDLKMCEEPLGGWGQFERAWSQTAEGKTM
ncbi:concanavalin A-like lectin/glucanase [Westerdykella ornata]|uniref:Concanavalin A-like lectin/glucanase n=1 Tax=Westerdykella ornata TaxID=318751 RepID=A0A6A6J809_WESOR|nr:concanavalin A-like lectin/glucanase [Westerdykella ornata]KAF2271766.1 concanavalin A-like lectin/glucanase [Westerdykella ornata]